MTIKQQAHQWFFERIGGFDQVKVESNADWQQLANLDSKLWAVLSCPVSQLSVDSQTLNRLDADADGRIRVHELRHMIEWLCDRLTEPNTLSLRQPSLPLNLIRQDTETTQALFALAAKITSTTDLPQHIYLADVEKVMADFAQEVFNGDGVITEDSVADDVLKTAFNDVLTTSLTVDDISGKQGINAELLTGFADAAAARLAWIEAAEADGILALGDTTAAAVAATDAIATKIDDFFTRCALVGFDEQAEQALNPNIETYEQMYAATLARSVDEVTSLPLARIQAAGELALTAGINPAWQTAMEQFHQLVVRPLLGEQTTITHEDWQQLNERLAAAKNWLANEQGAQVAALSRERLQAWQENSWFADLQTLIEQDAAKATELKQLEDLLTLLLMCRDIDVVVHNMISLRDFYMPGRKGTFEAGRLLIDGRSMNLAMRVEDVEQHAAMAQRSEVFLLYCDCTRRNGDEKISIVVAVTEGDCDHLMVGRHGVFYDHYDEEWDAVIVKMIENPISVRQAFWSPYKKIARMVSDQIEKFAASKERAITDKSTAIVEGAEAEAATKVAPFDIAKFAGIFAAIGLAIGAIGTALVSIISGFFSLPIWQIPLVFIGIMLLISGPAMFLAWLKLRRRNIGPMLDANGWAVNTQARISVPFGKTLTQVAELPDNAKRSLKDPYEPKSYWKLWFWLITVVVAAFIAWQWPALMAQLNPQEEIVEVDAENAEAVATEAIEAAAEATDAAE